MGKHLHAARELGKNLGASASRPSHDFQQQCLRVLRCTAHALANSPGGLRFQAGTRPWLDVLTHSYADATLTIPQGV